MANQLHRILLETTNMPVPNRKPTLRSIAEHLDTSVCTVSRVLNGKASQYRITEATEKRILDYAKEIDYRPHIAAQNLRLNRSQDVGLVLPDFSNPFFMHVAKCVAREARKRNFSIEVVETEDDTETEANAISQMLHRRLEGLIVLPVGIESKHFEKFVENAYPIVLVDRFFPGIELPQVSVDNISAAEMATRHLLDHGHREIACLHGLTDTTTDTDRIKGYRQALDEREIAVDEALIIGDGYTQSSGYRAIGQLLESRPTTTAILSLSNQITLGALRALAERGLRIPEDFSLVSFDDINGVEFFATPLTVVAQPLEKIGLKATELLFDHIDGNALPSEGLQLFPATLVTRESVKQIST